MKFPAAKVLGEALVNEAPGLSSVKVTEAFAVGSATAVAVTVTVAGTAMEPTGGAEYRPIMGSMEPGPETDQFTAVDDRPVTAALY